MISRYCFCRHWQQFSYRSCSLWPSVDIVDLNGCHPVLQINHLILIGNYTEHCKTSMVYCRIRVRSERATNCSLKRRLCADKDDSESRSTNLLLQDKPIPEGNNKIIEKHKEQQPRRLKFLNRTVVEMTSPWTTVTVVWYFCLRMASFSKTSLHGIKEHIFTFRNKSVTP